MSRRVTLKPAAFSAASTSSSACRYARVASV